jgi:hypothetical protein
MGAYRSGANWRRCLGGLAALTAAVVCLSGASNALAVTVESWQPVAIQAPSQRIVGQVYGGMFGNLDCVSASDCWSAARGMTARGVHIAWIEHWTGHGFKIDSDPNTNRILQAVTCVNARDCLAAGATESTTGRFSPLVMHWDGRGWTSMRVPDGSGTDDELADIACVSSRLCFGVGWNASGSGSRALVERWNGRAWSIVTKDSNLGPKGNRYTYLDEIKCFAASSCLLVGQSENPGDPPQAFGERLSKKGWTFESIPIPDPRTYAETSIGYFDCSSASHCLGAGAADLWPVTGPGETIPFAISWNGRRWSEVTPVFATRTTATSQVNAFGGDTCLSAASCWAVGSTFTDTNSNPGVVAHWNGTAFALADTDNPYPSDSLDAVGCAGAGNCLVTGSGLSSKSAVYHPVALKLTVVNCPRCTAPDPSADGRP